jgi:nucleotide-binding universal stress UspA family protein
MFKNLLLPYVNATTEGGPLTVAIALAQHFEAHLAVLVTVDVPPPMPNEWGVITNDYFVHALDEARKLGQTLAQRLRQRVVGLPRSTEVRLVESISVFPARTATLNARYADLTIVPNAPPNGAQSPTAHEYFEDLLTGSGGPVLVVPEATSEAPARRAVVAWQPTRESARAVRDAMPLLLRTESVDVLVIDPTVGEAGHGETPGADIATHLARHGLKVQVVARPSMGRTVAHAILEHANDVGADLIVAGGYGHSRWREFVLGGVTRDLLESTHIPILFSH